MRLVTFEASRGARVGMLLDAAPRWRTSPQLLPERRAPWWVCLRQARMAWRWRGGGGGAPPESRIPAGDVSGSSRRFRGRARSCVSATTTEVTKRQTARARPSIPEIFVKTSNVVVGPDDATVLPSLSSHVDYEGEMAIVIGADRSARVRANRTGLHRGIHRLQRRERARHSAAWQPMGAWASLSTSFGPMGPAIVTADEVGEPHAQTVTVECNGETTVRASTADMIFTVEFLVSYLSEVMTLEPGDIIATGTPGKFPRRRPESLPRPRRRRHGHF